ncbi:MAG TPA: integrase arm-type DNA-binding domain-containing protein [Xanthobacteraceae bacterium]
MAEAVKLSESTIAKAQLGAEQKQEILWDTAVTGFGLRILAGGSKTFWYQYRKSGIGRGGTSRMVRIGSWPAVSLADARKAARGYAGAVARGDDPAAEKQEERRRANATLRQLLDEDGEYEQSLKRRHLVNTKLIMSGLRRGLLRLMAKDVKDITRQDFVTAITAIEDQGKPGAAAELRKFSRTFCEWAVQSGKVTANVMAGLRKPKQTRAEKLAAEARKARALSDAEIIAVWNAAEGRGSFGNIIRFLLLTGARRGEIAKLTRDRVLSDRLVLPSSDTKMGEKHEVPLTALMRAVIAAQPTTPSKLAFPSEKTGGVISGWSKTVPALQRAAGVTFTSHDLRRTCRTLMSRLGVEPDIAELAIGHKRTGLDRLYNFDQAWQLRCDAFVKVSDHVARLLDRAAEKDKVVAIPART